MFIARDLPKAEAQALMNATNAANGDQDAVMQENFLSDNGGWNVISTKARNARIKEMNA